SSQLRAFSASSVGCCRSDVTETLRISPYSPPASLAVKWSSPRAHDERTEPPHSPLSLPEVQPPNTVLAATEPATSRWISEATARHSVTLLVYVALVVAGNLVGAQVDRRTYLVFGLWIALNLVIAPWAARPHEFLPRLRRYAVTVAVDVVFLGAVYYRS